MKTLSSVAMIMSELQSIKTLLMQQNEFLSSLGFESSEELEQEAGISFIESLRKSVQVKQTENIDYKISALLQELRIPTHQLGFSYLKEAIKMAYNDETVLNGITKVLYPTVASKFNTTGSRAERAMRHAIETSYFKNKHHSFYKYYDEKPTNSAFIADVIEIFKLKEQECAE